jgi:hypothetical protein
VVAPEVAVSTPHRQPAGPGRAFWSAVALVALLAVACGGSEDIMSRQDFVDNLGQRGGELLDENISSCMYDALEQDTEAREAVADWEDGEAVPEELFDLAMECLRQLPDTPDP